MRRLVRRQYQLGASGYAAALTGQVAEGVNTESLRRRAAEMVRSHVKEDWSDSKPVMSLKGGQEAPGTLKTIATVDAFGSENGMALLSTLEEATDIAKFAKSLETKKDVDIIKQQVRKAENLLFDPSADLAARLVANQALDFHKQDGATEIEEAIQVRPIERLLNDQLLNDEKDGIIHVDRSVAIVLSVSNFSNFLDLSRKVLRNVEVGVPVLIMSRGTVSQHCFRWAKMLADTLEGVESKNLINFLSADLGVQRSLLGETSLLSESPAYLTGSRGSAIAVKELMRRTFASCGGPNTMVLCADAAFDLTSFAAAARDSAFIEHSGQCTALRHVVAPGAAALKPADFERKFLGEDDTVVRASAADALESSTFANLLPEAPRFADSSDSLADDLRKDGYTVAGDHSASSSAPLAVRDAKDRVAWRVTSQTAPSKDWQLEEHWRRVVLDISAPPSRAALLDEQTSDKLADWLLEQQPISVAVNKSALVDNEALRFARRLWEKSACSVFTVGDVVKPALTAQARPQDGEIFGEVPPRAVLDKHTASPVFVPSSTPATASFYDEKYLESLAALDFQHELTPVPPGVQAVIRNCESKSTKGFCLLLWRYLADAARGPRQGTGNRACLYGLQRPPLGSRGKTWLRVSANDSFDSAAPAIVAFVATNAASQLRASTHPSNTDAIARMTAALGEGFVADVFARKLSDAEFEADVRSKDPWNVVRASDYDSGARLSTPNGKHFGLVANLVARLFPIGHVKSTRTAQEDPVFLEAFEDSPKWLLAAWIPRRVGP